MSFLYVFPGGDKEGRALWVQRREDGKLVVAIAPCLKNRARDKAIGRAVCRARLTAYQYEIMTVEELAAYLERIGGEPVTPQHLQTELGLKADDVG